jgi:hypothetical protein
MRSEDYVAAIYRALFKMPPPNAHVEELSKIVVNEITRTQRIASNNVKQLARMRCAITNIIGSGEHGLKPVRSNEPIKRMSDDSWNKLVKKARSAATREEIAERKAESEDILRMNGISCGEFTCDNCKSVGTCIYAFDGYCTNGDCLNK